VKGEVEYTVLFLEAFSDFMLTLPLAPTSSLACPAFKDEASCVHWLGQLQLTNLQQAHNQLLHQLNVLNSYTMRGLERLNTLEVLYETLCHVQDDFSKKLIGKPLPLNENELLIFKAIVQLWQALLTGYQHCLQAHIDGDRQLARHGALLCQRCLHFKGLEILEYLRTGYEFGAQLWQQLHELYAYAEHHDLHEIAVAAPCSEGTQVQHSCLNSYVITLLAGYAHPAQLTRWQLQHLARWLSLWCANITISRTCDIVPDEAQPLAVDLSSTQGLQPCGDLPHSDTLRYLIVAPLGRLLRAKTTLLQQGQTPRQLNLGDHYDSPACIELLIFLHQSWCENTRKRQNQRQPIAKNADLCYKLEGIFAHLSGKPFKQRDHSIDVEASQRVEPFGPELHLAQNKELVEMGYPLENWQMENESVIGVRLSRVDSIGGRFNYKQLVALRPCDAQAFILGTIAWTNVAQNSRLQMGLKYLPGLPEPVSVRSSDLTPSTVYAPAFLLPALPSLNISNSLILPRDWFQVDRLIELLYLNGQKCYIRLDASIERGLDYERVSYTPAQKNNITY